MIKREMSATKDKKDMENLRKQPEEANKRLQDAERRTRAMELEKKHAGGGNNKRPRKLLAGPLAA